MSNGPKPLVAGNWKMNGLKDDAEALAAALKIRVAEAGSTLGCELAVCPPSPLIPVVGDVLFDSPVAFGAQDCHTEQKGAHTGDVSAWLLADLGCQYVIVGHSERRQNHCESSELVNAKATAAHAAGLTSIVCVGETLAQYEAGDTLAMVERQVRESLPQGASATNLVVAYEPVWAIGSGLTPTTDDITKVHAHIRAVLAAALGKGDDAAGVRLLYGGSVKPGNAADILAIDNVDGALVGGASLKVEDFLAIATAAC